MAADRLLIVSDGLVAGGLTAERLEYALHPALQPWRKQLQGCSREWFSTPSKTAVEWYAVHAGSDVATLFSASLADAGRQGFRQFWIASPFHARLARDKLRVMPDALLAWREEDATWLCNLLNPLLNEDGMKLISHHAMPLLLCREPLHAAPISFAAVSGHTLPNRHPEGADGGRLMRLTSEIQMLLNQQPAQQRQQRGESDVDGVWFWGGGEIGNDSAPVFATPTVAVATRNPLLRSVATAKDARVIISEVDRLAELVKPDRPLPKIIVLAGSGHAVLLKQSWLPKFGKRPWQPKSVQSEMKLAATLQDLA